MSLGVAIIGAGLIGTKRAAALPSGVTLRTVFDDVPERAQALAGAYPGAVATQSLEAALDDTGVGLVIVATPHHQLTTIGIEAVRRGRDVLLEKPGAHRLDALLALEQAASEASRRVRVGFNHRFHPSFLRAREVVGSGTYGEVFAIRARYGHGGRPGYEKEWRAQREISGGGELIDQGLHLIDLVRYLVGDVDLAFSELRTDFWAMDVEDNAYLALRARAGAFAWLHASWTEWKNLFSFELTMHDAKLDVQGLGGSYGTERLTLYEMSPEMGPPPATSWEWPPPDASWSRELADVVTDIEGGSSVGADLSDCIAAFRVVEEAYGR
jgi:predicted dehydrogenase